MNSIFQKSLLASAVLAALSISATQAQAAGTITFGEDKYISVGFGAIGSYNSVEDAAANNDDRSNDFSLDSARIYISGSLNKYIKGMLNTEKSGGGVGGNIEIIDANVQFQITPEIAIWAGRFLSPSDRANMAGPYYSMGGGYWANVASRYGWNGGPLHDPLTCAYLLAPELFVTQPMYVEVDTSGGPSSGRTNCDLWNLTDEPPNAEVALQVDADGFYELLTERLGRL